MNNILGKCLDKFAIVFIDDILIYSKDEKELEEHLIIVLQILREHKVYAKLSKCEFYKDQIQYLGHIISKEGITVDPNKIKTIMNWPEPKDVSGIRSFMSITIYYQKFT
jgi:hypothetical protein